MGSAVRSFRTAKQILDDDPDKAASIAYYTAFYAVSALFCVEQRFFRKHAAIRDAVHQELVHSGRWSAHLGQGYDDLIEARIIGDYGGDKHVSSDDAAQAIANARAILEAVRRDIPEPLADFE